MFFIGGLPALLAVYIRSGVKESEVWERTKQENWSTSAAPSLALEDCSSTSSP